MTQAQAFDLIKIILPFVLTTIVAPLIAYLITRLPAAQQARATRIATTVVAATEQYANKQVAGMSSEEKKARAVADMTALLKAAHISLDPIIVNMLIEAAVFALNQAGQAAANASAVITPLPPISSTSIKQ